VARISQGSIIRAVVTDTKGGNPKPRPLVVISTNSEIDREGIVFAVAITGEFNEPPLADEIILPFCPKRRCRTGLTKKCVAKCTWQREVRLTDVLEIKGHAPTTELELILAGIKRPPARTEPPA
jgi:hypothetical protein